MEDSEQPYWAVEFASLDDEWAIAVGDARRLWPDGEWPRPLFLWASLGTSVLQPPSKPSLVNFDDAIAADRLEFARANLKAALEQIEDWPDHKVEAGGSSKATAR